MIAYEYEADSVYSTRHSDFNIDYSRKVHGPGITLIGAHTNARPKSESHQGWWTTRDDVMAVKTLYELGRLEFSGLIGETYSPVETDEIHTVKYAIMAADHGKHIHMEKPGRREPEDFEKLIEIMRRTGKGFHTGYMYRCNPFVMELMDRIRSGKMGEIISVEAQMNCWHPEGVRRWLGGLPGGMMFFLGCHLVDLVLQIQGMPDNIIPLNRSTGLDGLDSIDYGMAVMEYKNGVSFVKASAAERGGYMRRQLVVTGTNCTVEIKPFEYGPESAMRTEQTLCTETQWGTRGEHAVSDEFSRYDSMMASFGAMVRGEKENPWTLDYELTLYRTLLRCCGVQI